MLGQEKIFIGLVLIFFVLFIFEVPSVYAQTNTGFSTQQDAVYGSDGVDVLYSHTSGVNLIAHSQGAGVSYRYGKYLTSRKSRSISMGLSYIKDSKEVKSSNPVYIESLPYVLGKVNSFIVFRLNLENRSEITPKLRKGAVQIGKVSRLGGSLGVLKPVYLEIGYPVIPYEYTEIELYNPEEHFYNDILGRAPWINGLDQLSVIPGVHASYGLYFEYGNVRGVSKSFEVGINADYFMSDIEILTDIFVEPNKFFLTLYLKMGIGANWTQAE